MGRDDEAKRRGTWESILERKGYPAFEIIIEIHQANIWTIHEDVAMSTDLLLRKDSLIHQRRQFKLGEKIQIQCEKVLPSQNEFVKDSYSDDNTRLDMTKRWTQFNTFKLINYSINLQRIWLYILIQYQIIYLKKFFQKSMFN